MESELMTYIANVDEVIMLLKRKANRIEDERDALQAKCNKYEVALKVAQIALQTCYDVIKFPAGGQTRQDKSIEVINKAYLQITNQLKDD